MTWLEPFQYAFFQRATWAAVLVGALCGFLGLFVVVRRMSYVGHGLSHAVLGGAAVSYLLRMNFYVGAALAGVLCMLLIARTSRRPEVGSDAAIGVVTTAAFALGVAVFSRVQGPSIDFEALLFGDVLGIGPSELRWLIGFTLLIGFVGLVLYRSLIAVTLDADAALLRGMPVRLIESVFALMLASVIVVSLRLVGATLISAALIIPAATARLIARGFDQAVWLATAFGALAGGLGMYASYFADTASGAAIVLIAALGFGLVYALAGWRQTTRPPAGPESSAVTDALTDNDSRR